MVEKKVRYVKKRRAMIPKGFFFLVFFLITWRYNIKLFIPPP